MVKNTTLSARASTMSLRPAPVVASLAALRISSDLFWEQYDGTRYTRVVNLKDDMEVMLNELLSIRRSVVSAEVAKGYSHAPTRRFWEVEEKNIVTEQVLIQKINRIPSTVEELLWYRAAINPPAEEANNIIARYLAGLSLVRNLDDGTPPLRQSISKLNARLRLVRDTICELGLNDSPRGTSSVRYFLSREEKSIEQAIATFTVVLGGQADMLEGNTENVLLEEVASSKSKVNNTYTLKRPEDYTQPFCDFLTENPTVFHAVDYFAKKLTAAGFKKLSERNLWTSELKKGGKYFVERNGSSLIAFEVGLAYKSGNGVAMVAGHVDALTARLKPVSTKKNAAGYVQLGVTPYAGALNSTWWDRDLGIGGRVLLKDPQTGKITTRLVKLGWPIARIPTLAPHFGVGMLGTNNAETQAVPIIGLDNSDIQGLPADDEWRAKTLGGATTFASTQPPKLVRAIAAELSIQDYSTIVNWELELYDTQPAQVGGLEKEFIFAGRVDDKLCSWSAMEGLLASPSVEDSGNIKLVGVFDDEEIGSLLRQGARGNFLPSTVERICESFAEKECGANVLSQTYANSFLISADVIHAVNPNFLGSYLENHAPRLNIGMVVSADSNGHMTTDSVSTALLTSIAEKSGSELQVFMVRNDSRSGGTVGPMLSAAMGVRAIDAGIPQLSMHSIRATTGSLDPGLGVKLFSGFFEHFEEVDAEFE